MENPTLPPQVLVFAKSVAAAAQDAAARERTARLVEVLGFLYRVAVILAASFLVYAGGSAWLLIAAVPLLWFGPKARRS